MELKELKPTKALKKALPFLNDSNTLNKHFYNELLHIIGLAEIKVGNRKLIERNKACDRNSGSILEGSIIQLDSLDKINRLERPDRFGKTYQDRLFNVALELSITWVNRILFLKLLEAQLLKYHKGDSSYAFLNSSKIKNYDDLNRLFFQALAKKNGERNQYVKETFGKVPYLNSSLFEPTAMEHATLLISKLEDGHVIPVFSHTVLKDQQGKKLTGNLPTLNYLFKFLDAYDFSGGGAGEVQEKTPINASVLGLIFEKINGYKDGSFFTPGFITMFMCRETIRKAVIRKFNEVKNWDCRNLEDLYDKIEDRKEANEIVNSVKICDPAVGSGHFLVSSLNEIIAIKNDLKILQDRAGKRLKEYQVEVANDELIVRLKDGKPFQYNPNNQESQRVQEALFHEKQTIIESCLFGVDLNPNSVNICRLRLWIELLKNAYYRDETALETLPNIDINIKCGNSLLSRFSLEADLKYALKKSGHTIEDYRSAVATYRNAKSKEQKGEMERFITKIKSDFGIHSDNDFKNAFEWRFEFPEVLDENGDFTGFDVIIGNPPYGVKLSDNEKKLLKNTVFNSNETAILFIHKGRELLKKNGIQSYIIPKAFTYASNYTKIREIIKDELSLIVDCNKPWQEVKLEACIFQIERNRQLERYDSLIVKEGHFIRLTETPKSLINDFGFILNGINEIEIELAKKIKHNNLFFGDVSTNKRGVGIQSHLLAQGNYTVLGGIDIERNTIRKSQRGYLSDISNIDEIGKIQHNSVLVQNIVSHLTNPVGHIKIIAALPPLDKDKYIILDTINQLVFEKNVSNTFACALLNSKLINWYVYNFIYAKAVRTMHFDNVVTNRIPFPKKYIGNRSRFDNRSAALNDNEIYGLFGLTEPEIALIESTFER